MSNLNLLNTINDLESELSTADLGNHLFKVRVKREHSGKNSGFRTIILFKADDKAIFLLDLEKMKKKILIKRSCSISKNWPTIFYC